MRHQKIRHGWRILRRAPALTLVSVLTMALAVGAGTSVLTGVKPVLLNPLPYTQPDRLVRIIEKIGRFTHNSASHPETSAPRREDSIPAEPRSIEAGGAMTYFPPRFR